MNGAITTVVDELLRYKASSNKDTKIFKKLKHNKHLCPAVEKQGNQILDCFVKYHSVAYDVQGITDRGTDVLLRYYTKSKSEEPNSRFIAFQIKSYDDLETKKYLKDLKAQCFESMSAFGDLLDQYYILICTDSIAHKNKIRQIKSAFANAENTTIIDPTYAYTFLRLNALRISSVVSAILRDEDLVYEEAVKTIIEFTPTEIAGFLAIVYDSIVSRNSIINFENIYDRLFISDTYNVTPDYPREHFFYIEEKIEEKPHRSVRRLKKQNDKERDIKARFAEDIDSLDGRLFSYDGDSHKAMIDFDFSLPIQAIILDAMVRYGYKDDQLLRYLFNSLDVFERFGINVSDQDSEDWIENIQ